MISRSLESAGRPASSWMMWPSADVIVSSGPNGAAPWETHGSTSTPSSRTPTAPPLSMTSSSRNRAASPSLVRALATPPMIVTPGARSATASSTWSVGKEIGSGSRIAAAAPSRSGTPETASPSKTSSTPAWNGCAMPSPSHAAHTETAVPSSTS